MGDGARGRGAEREGAGESSVSAKGRSRRRWSDEDKARVVGESLRPGERVGEVARRYGVSRWQLSVWRGLARKGKLALACSAVGERAFAALEVEPVSGRGSMGSVVVEAHGVTVRLAGDVGVGRIAQIAAALRTLR